MFSSNLGLRLVEILLLTLTLVQLLKILQSTLPILIKTFSSNPTSIHSTKSFLIPSIVAHARFLPRKSKHKFTYPALFITTELNALENGGLDLGRWFTWNAIKKGKKRRWSILSLIPDEYLRLKFPQLEEKWNGKLDQDDEIILHEDRDPITPQSQRLRGSILLKLVYELRSRGFLKSGPQDDDWGDDQETNPDKNHHHRGWRSELGQVWSLTMPSIFGFQGINPLTVYYCYRPYGYRDQTSTSTSIDDNHDLSSSSSSERGPFWLTVLEVHNTFSERHVYILESNVDEDRDQENENGNARRKGYQHQWTFERSFHVSPFNDRGGYYCLMMNELFGSGKDGDEDTRLIDDRTRENVKVGEKEKEVDVELPRIDIRLLLLVHSSNQDSSNIQSSNLESSSNSDSTSSSSQSESSSSSSDAASSSNPSSSSSPTSTLTQSSSDLEPPTSTATPKLQKKLLATLQSHPSNHSKRPISLSPQSIFQSLSRQPLDLFLTTFRILWEAGKLHFGKKLDAFARPDMMQRKEAAEIKNGNGDGDDEFDGIGLPPVLNAVESVRNQKSKPNGKEKKNDKENFGGLLWPQESWIEKIAREAFLRFSSIKLNSNLDANVKSLKIISTDEAVDDISIQSKSQDQLSKENQDLKIFIRSPSFYTDLLLYPTPDLALVFGSRIGRRWGISDVEQFRNFFLDNDDDDSTRKGSYQERKDWKSKAMDRIRVRHLNFCLNLIHQSGNEKKSQEMKAILLNEISTATSHSNEPQLQSRKLQAKDLLPHPFEKTSISLNLLISLFLLHLATIVEYHIFNLLGARYVENTEPWLEISRGLELLSREKKREKLEESWDLLEDVSEDAGKDTKGVRKEKGKAEENRRDKPGWLELGSVRRE